MNGGPTRILHYAPGYKPPRMAKAPREPEAPKPRGPKPNPPYANTAEKYRARRRRKQERKRAAEQAQEGTLP